MLGLNVRQLLQTIENHSPFQAVGRLRSAGGLLTASIPSTVGELCRLETGWAPAPLAEVIAVRQGVAQLMPYHELRHVSAKTNVVALGQGLSVPCGEGLLGRVLDGMGNPIDGKGALPDSVCWREARQSVPPPLARPPIDEIMPTGVRAIDGLLTLGVGQRVGLFAGSGVGKSSLLGEIARNCQSDRNVIVLVGERGREVAPFVKNCLGAEGLARSVVIVTTSDQTPLMRVRSVQVGIAIADEFRTSGRRVLMLLDSLTRLAMAQREIGLLLGEPPTSRGYTPSVFQLLATVLEQLGCSPQGSVTAIATVLVDGDDINDPIADSVRSIVDGHIVLDRRLAELNHYPAIDIGRSLSRVFAEITDEAQQVAARKIRTMLATYKDAEDLIRAGAYASGSSQQIDKAIELMPRLHQFLKQNLHEPCSMSESRKALMALAALWPTAKQG